MLFSHDLWSIDDRDPKLTFQGHGMTLTYDLDL